MTMPPDDHLKSLWTSQKTEVTPMSVEMIRGRSEALLKRSRRGIIVFGAVSAGVIAMFGWRAATADYSVLRAGYVLTIAGYLWMVWRIARHWPRGGLPDAGASAAVLLDFHRAQLVRLQAGYVPMIVTVAPVILGLLVATAGLARMQLNPQALPLLGLIVVWCGVFLVLVRMRGRRLKAQIEELDRLRDG